MTPRARRDKGAERVTVALLFPGQGSQKVGMGAALAREFPDAAETFLEADDLLGFSLSRLMWEGPESELALTRNAQPAILVHSVAALRAGGERLVGARMAAGHSLGEFSAHVAAGTLRFADALSAVRLRGTLMFEAGERRPGTMAAVLGMEDEAAELLCREVSDPPMSVVVTANYNAPGQIVISGDVEAVGRAAAEAPSRGAKRVVPLSVSGAFHSPLMGPAEEGLRAHLASINFGRLSFPVYSNVAAEPVSEGETARELLVRQLTAPVRWSRSVERMVAAGATQFIEVGPGQVLARLNKRIAKGIPTVSFGEPDDLAALG
ncbi:MAG: ACP S-malonyltransferase [Gemmatimonadota bacterium]